MTYEEVCMKDNRCSDFEPTFNEAEPCKYYIEKNEGRICGLCKKPERYRCINDLGYKPLPLSHSNVQSFLTCHHLFYLQQVLGVKVKDAHTSKPLKMGQLWDACQRYALGEKDMSLIDNVITGYDIDEVEVQKVKGLYKAWKQLGIRYEEGYELQKKIDNAIVFEEGACWGTGEPVELRVRGFIDRSYPEYFAENKMSSKPDLYTDIFFIQSQVGTYFIADPGLKSVVMEVVRTPDLKMSKKEEDSPETYGNRIYHDAISRPAHYFIGYNPERNTYGKRFYRNEFDLNDVRSRYKHIFREIYEAAALGGWYKNDRSCKNILPGIVCDMLGACRYGKLSDEVYEIRSKEF
jgi:hypothetical protein